MLYCATSRMVCEWIRCLKYSFLNIFPTQIGKFNSKELFVTKTVSELQQSIQSTGSGHNAPRRIKRGQRHIQIIHINITDFPRPYLLAFYAAAETIRILQGFWTVGHLRISRRRSDRHTEHGLSIFINPVYYNLHSTRVYRRLLCNFKHFVIYSYCCRA